MAMFRTILIESRRAHLPSEGFLARIPFHNVHVAVVGEYRDSFDCRVRKVLLSTSEFPLQREVQRRESEETVRGMRVNHGTSGVQSCHFPVLPMSWHLRTKY